MKALLLIFPVSEDEAKEGEILEAFERTHEYRVQYS